MKFFAKANKGALLSLAVLIVLVIYLVIVGTSQAKDQPALESACKNYVAVAQQYSLLPKDYQDGSKLMSSSQQDQYLSDIKTALTPQFDSGSAAALNATCNTFKQNLQQVFTGQKIVTSNQITITQYTDFTYSDNLVSVSFNYTLNSNIGIQASQGNVLPSAVRQNAMPAVITFKKVNGSFRIVSVNLFNATAAPSKGVAFNG